MTEQSKWNVEVPWQEGKEEDFAELREHLEKVKIDGGGGGDEAEDSDSDDTITQSDEDEEKLMKRFHNQFEENGSESEDDPEEVAYCFILKKNLHF